MNIRNVVLKNQFVQSPQWLGIALFVLLAIPAILHSAHTFNYHHLENRARQVSNTVSHDVGERIGVIRTVLASLEGLYYVSPELDRGKLSRFSRKLLDNSPYITTLGRYESVSREDRIDFESRMVDEGFVGFAISEIGDDGEKVSRDNRSHYYPISILEPLQPDNAAMVGVDFGSISGMAETLKSVAKDNSVVLAALPETWSHSANLIAFNPVYRGKETPDSEKAMLQQTTGGFWLGIDVDQLLEGIPELAGEFRVSVELVTDDNRQLLYERSASNTTKLYFSSLHPTRSFENEWSTAASASLVINLEQPLGFTEEVVILAGLALATVLFVTVLFSVHIINNESSAKERLKDQQTLEEEREKAQKTLNTVQDAIITLDPAICVVQINPAAALLFNTKPKLAIGRPLADIVQFHELNNTYDIFNIEQILAQLAYDGKREFDVVPVGYNSDDFVLRLSLSSSHNQEGNVSGHVLVIRDISHERRMSRKLAYQANYDALTNCTNRYYFEQTLDALIKEIPRTKSNHALCYMDLDQFKVVNDSCGHRAGDQLLIELTKKLKMLIRDTDVLSRLGGDEFGLIMVDISRAEAAEISNRIYDFFQNFIFKHEEFVFSVTASLGLVHIDNSCANMKDVLAAADIACYSAKDSGRNSLSVYSKTDEGMAERSIEMSWLPRLQKALQENQFRLYLQPVASLDRSNSQQRTTHFEFLLRLRDSDGSEMTPWQIIQAAERYDLMREIDKWVIRNSLQTVAELQSGPGAQCSYSINLSGQSAADPSLKTFIETQMNAHQIDPSKIWFELTETAAISHFSVAVDLIKNIRSFGSKVALDDFGSGLSSFGYLKNLPVDIIKIDGQFVKEISRNPIDREMVRAIHQVGKSMNIVSVAEFVEDQATIDELIKIGVNYAQGYFIGKPQRVEDAISQLSIDSKAA